MFDSTFHVRSQSVKNFMNSLQRHPAQHFAIVPVTFAFSVWQLLTSLY